MADKFQIEKIIQEYDLGQIISINDQSHGYANENFAVKTCNKDVFVRFCKQQNLENVKQEMILMKILRQKSFLTAYPIMRNDGDYISMINDMPVLLYEFVEGDLPELNPGVISEIAFAVANLSKIDYPEELCKKNAISLSDCRDIIQSEVFENLSYKDVKEGFRSLFDMLEENLSIEVPRGIVHGDVFPDNTLYSNDKLLALIDFEEFAIDSLMFDVGMTINGFCFEGLQIDMQSTGHFIKEYNTVRSLSDKELDLLVDYICWGAVGMTSWHLHQLLYRKNKKQLTRIRVLLERARLVLDNRKSLEDFISLAIS